MTTLVDLQVAADDTVMGRAFDAVPGLECELEQVITSAGRGLWVGGARRSDVESALERDPTVESYATVAEGEDRLLYDLAFADDPVDPFELITGSGGTVLTAAAESGTWSLRTRFVDRDDVGAAYDRLAEEGVETTVVRIQELAGEAGAESGLTAEQHETLVAAVDHGYFSIPREVSMQELADELGVSHQALSERFRRAYRTLVATELNVSDETTTPSQPVHGD